ncbi:MAG: GNAT family N-acetyltransferase [Candidatus Heimdallarchaeaceae archaeon]
MNFKIRPRENEEDMKFFHKLDYESFRTTIKDIETLTEEEILEKYDEFLKSDPLDVENDPNHQIFILEDNQMNRIGLIWVANRAPFWRFKEQHVWIYNLHILAEFRGRGLARMLMLKAEEWAKEQGLNNLALHVIDNNKVARKLYESLNYVLVATHNESCFYEKSLITK